MTLAADASNRSDDETPSEPPAVPERASPLDATSVAPVDYASPGLDATHVGPPTRRLALPGAAESRATRVAWWTVAIAVACLYFAFLMCYWAPAHPGVDQNGYLVGGRQYAQTFSSGLKPESDFGFVGRMWIRTTDDATGWYYPKYPLGLPIYYAANLWAGRALGFDGHETAQLLSPIGATLAILGVFAIVRRLSGGFMGVMAMLLCGLGQVMLTLSINPNSHAAGTGAVVCGFAFLLGWLERGTLWRGVMAGLCFGIAYTIRYTEGLLLLPMGVAMLYATRWALPSLPRALATAGGTLAFVALAVLVGKVFGDWMLARMPWLSPLYEDGGKPFKALVGLLAAASLVWMFIPWRTLWRLLAVAGAWLVPVVYLTLFNMVAMRSFTSYAGTNESTGFGYDYFMGNWEKMVRVLADQGLFFIAPLGLLGLLLMVRRLPIVAAILALWFFPSVLLYTAYYWAPDNFGVSYSRFVLTQLPALVVSAAWLIGEAAGLRRTAGRVGWVRPSMTAGALAAAVAIAGFAVAGLAVAKFDPRRDPTFWLLAVPGAIAGVVALGRLTANVPVAGHLRTRFEQHVSGALPRVAVGAVVFVSCALGSWRTVEGVEWGQRANSRGSLEVSSRENNNLAQLGRVLRDATAREPSGKKAATPPVADDKILLFADGERLHHLQWIGDWATFDANAFTPEAGRRYAVKQAFTDNDPDPIDPNTCAFMRGIYANKDEKALVAEQNKLMSEALASGKRIFYVLNKPAANVFERRYVNGRPFETRVVAIYCEMPSPRRPEEFLPPEEQPKQPVGRSFIRQNVPARFTTPERQTFRIVEVVAKGTPATPAVANAAPSKEDVMMARRNEAVAAQSAAKPTPPAAAPAKPAVATATPKPAVAPAARVVPATKPAVQAAQATPATRPAPTAQVATAAKPAVAQAVASTPPATKPAIVTKTPPPAGAVPPTTRAAVAVAAARPTTAAATRPTLEQRVAERRARAESSGPATTRASVEQRLAERRARADAASTTRPADASLTRRMEDRRAARSATTAPAESDVARRMAERRAAGIASTPPTTNPAVPAVVERMAARRAALDAPSTTRPTETPTPTAAPLAERRAAEPTAATPATRPTTAPATP